MSHSLNEIGGLCRRAARGAGLSWGLADEAANGARWLAAFELPGARLLVERLERFGGDTVAALTPVVSDGAWHGTGGRLCPVIAGAALSDRSARFAIERQVEMRDVVFPLLCCPFAADVASALAVTVEVHWNGVRATTDGERLRIEGQGARIEAESCERLRCTVGDEALSPDAASPRVRGQVDADTWARLSRLAGLTYAPATEESRRRGAGGADDG